MSLYVSSNLYIRGETKYIKKFLNLLPKKYDDIKDQFFERLTGSNEYKNATFLIEQLILEKDSIYLQTSENGYNPIELVKIISSRQPELVFELVCFTMEVPSAYCQIIKYGDIIGESSCGYTDTEIDIYDFYESNNPEEEEDDGDGTWDYDGITKILVENAHEAAS